MMAGYMKIRKRADKITKAEMAVSAAKSKSSLFGDNGRRGTDRVFVPQR